MTRTNLFTSSVTFKLCELDADGNLVDTEDITIQNLTIEGITYLNSYIRQHYLTAQNEATKNWEPKERKDYLKLAMSRIVNLSIDTVDGRAILWETSEGTLHYSWVFVKHRFPTFKEWENFMQDVRVYNEITSRLHTAWIDLAMLTSQEPGGEVPEEQNTEYIGQTVAALMAKGLSKEEAMKLTLDEAWAVLNPQNESADGIPVASTNNPEEFTRIIREKLEEKKNE